jgi:hypothetical protein
MCYYGFYRILGYLMLYFLDIHIVLVELLISICFYLVL